MQDEWKKLLENLIREVPIKSAIDHDVETRNVYLEKTLRLLHIMKAADCITIQDYEQVLKIRHKVNICWHNFLKGKVNTAASQMQNLLNKSIDDKKYMDYFKCDKRLGVLYRGRCSSIPLNKPEDFYHIPFTKRYLIGNQRYSLSGIPCLYLASSINCVKKEIVETNEKPLYLCSFTCDQNMELFDVSIGYDQLLNVSPSETELRNFLYKLPLIIACSICATDNQDAMFKSNYIIPQLVTASLYNMRTDVSGICYITNKASDLCYEDACNYVFLPVYRHQQTYDDVLLSQFTMNIKEKVIA